MSIHRTKATFIGLLEAGRVNEWVVTEKLGDIMKMKLQSKASRKLRTKIREIQERYIIIILLSLCISQLSYLNIDMESGCIFWSLVLQPISSLVDATICCLGKDITIYFFSCNPPLSSSSAWDMSGHSSRTDYEFPIHGMAAR
jgi:hypothetical protein